MRLTVTQFRRKLSASLDRVEKGEIIEILRRGKPVAKIVSVLPSWKRPGPRLTIPGVSLAKLILKERRSGR